MILLLTQIIRITHVNNPHGIYYLHLIQYKNTLYDHIRLSTLFTSQTPLALEKIIYFQFVFRKESPPTSHNRNTITKSCTNVQTHSTYTHKNTHHSFLWSMWDTFACFASLSIISILCRTVHVYTSIFYMYKNVHMCVCCIYRRKSMWRVHNT